MNTKYHYQPGDIVLVGANKNGEVRHEVIKHTNGSRHMTIAPLTKLGKNINRQFMVAVDCVQPLSQGNTNRELSERVNTIPKSYKQGGGRNKEG